MKNRWRLERPRRRSEAPPVVARSAAASASRRDTTGIFSLVPSVGLETTLLKQQTLRSVLS